MLLAVATALLLVLSHVFRREASAQTQHTENQGENTMTTENTTSASFEATETADLSVSIRADYFWHAAQFASEEQAGGGHEVLRGVCVEPVAEGVLIYALDGHQLCCWHDAAGYADRRRVIMPTPDMLAIVKPSFTRRGHTPGTLAINACGVWLLTRGHTSISGIKAFDTPQNFPEVLPFISRAASYAPSDAPTTLPALDFARFAFGKLSTSLTLTALDDGRMVSVANTEEPDFFGLIMGMLPNPENPGDLRAPRFIRQLLGDEDDAEDSEAEPEAPIVVTQPGPVEPRATRKRRCRARRVSRRPTPEAEPQAAPAPLALPESPAPLLPAVVIAAPLTAEDAPQGDAGTMSAAPTSEPRARFRTARSVRRQARRIAPRQAVPGSRPAVGFPGIAVGLAAMLALAGTIGGRPLELATLLLSQALA